MRSDPPGADDQSDETAEPDDAGRDAIQDRDGLGVVMRVGVELAASVLVGLAIGWGLDRWFGTRPLFLIVMVLLGGVAGIVNVWRLVRVEFGGSGQGAGRLPR